MKNLDPLLHSQLRLAVMSVLMNLAEADFVYLREKTESTAGNLSVQLDKLATAGYIEIEKGFVGREDTHTVPHHAARTQCLRNIRRCPEKLPQHMNRH